MSRKLLAANLTIALVLVCLGVLQARHDAERASPVPQQTTRWGSAPDTPAVKGRNLLLVEGFESGIFRELHTAC